MPPRRLAPALLLAILAPPLLGAPQGGDDGPDVYGYWRGRVLRTDGPLEAGPGGEDLAGLRNEARFGLDGRFGRARYRAAVQLLEATDPESPGGSEVFLIDAFVEAPLSEAVIVRAGYFRAPFLFSANLEANDTVFPIRTALGAAWDAREVGVQLAGVGGGPVSWKVAALDGGDGDGEELLLVGRAVYQVSGSPVTRGGAAGDRAASNVAVAISYAEDTALDEGDAFAAELYGTDGGWYLGAEAVEYGDGFTAAGLPGSVADPAAGRGGTRPWSATLARAMSEDLELAGRYEELDDPDGTERWTVGLFSYFDGARGKWGLSYRDQTSGDPALEGEAFELTVTLGF